MCIVAACTGVYPKNMALGQVVTQIVGHVDTVWETKKPGGSRHSNDHACFQSVKGQNIGCKFTAMTMFVFQNHKPEEYDEMEVDSCII